MGLHNINVKELNEDKDPLFEINVEEHVQGLKKLEKNGNNKDSIVNEIYEIPVGNEKELERKDIHLYELLNITTEELKDCNIFGQRILVGYKDNKKSDTILITGDGRKITITGEDIINLLTKDTTSIGNIYKLATKKSSFYVNENGEILKMNGSKITNFKKENESLYFVCLNNGTYAHLTSEDFKEYFAILDKFDTLNQENKLSFVGKIL